MNTLRSVWNEPKNEEPTPINYKEQAALFGQRYNVIFSTIIVHLKRLFPNFANQKHSFYFSSVRNGEVDGIYGSMHIKFPEDITHAEVEWNVLKWIKNWEIIIDGNKTELHPGIEVVPERRSPPLMIIQKQVKSGVKGIINTLLPPQPQAFQPVRSQEYPITGKTHMSIQRKSEKQWDT